MKKILFWLYTVLHVLWVPLVVSVPLLTVEQHGPNEFTIFFPGVTLLPLAVILEVVLRKRYRKELSLLSTRFWIVTGLISLAITIGLLLLSLPDMPFYNQRFEANNFLHQPGFIFSMIIFGICLQLLTTVPEIIARKKTVGLHKKEKLFS